MSIKKSISEVCRECEVSEEFVLQFINEEWITPIEEDFFDEEDLARLRLIQELREDFGVNDEGIPIILHLIDQLNRLRIEIRKGGPALADPL